jgi:hypothetical protein
LLGVRCIEAREGETTRLALVVMAAHAILLHDVCLNEVGLRAGLRPSGVVSWCGVAAAGFEAGADRLAGAGVVRARRSDPHERRPQVPKLPA